MELNDLKAARRLLETTRTPAGRVPAETRREVVSVAVRAHESGMRYEAIAEALGLDQDSLYRLRWVERSRSSKQERRRGERGLVAVRVASEGGAKMLVLHGPLGVRVEGLTLDELTELLRRLS